MRPAIAHALYLADVARSQEVMNKLGLNQSVAVLCFQTNADLANRLRDLAESRGIPVDAVLSPLMTEVLTDILSDPEALGKRLDAMEANGQTERPDMLSHRARVVASFAVACASSRMA